MIHAPGCPCPTCSTYAYQGGGKIAEQGTPAGISDSGHRKGFESGAQRDRVAGKGRFDLLSPIGLRRVAVRAELGAIKYGDGRNWEKGMPVGVFMDSAIRHIMDYMQGDTTEDHLAAAAWNLMAAMHTEDVMPEMQDIPTRPKFDTKVLYSDDGPLTPIQVPRK